MDKEERSVEEELRRHRLYRFLVPVVLLILVLTAAAIYWFFVLRNGFSRADLVGKYEASEKGPASYSSFAGGFLRYSRDGVSFLDADGQEKWNTSFSMEQPRLVLHGDYGAIADISGRRVVVFSGSGLSGTYSTNADILGIAVSAGGLTAIALDKDLTSLIQLYDATGKRLDIEMSFEMSMSGYPLAMALSPDGAGLVISFVNSSIGSLNSQIAFYNFSVGKSEPDRLIGFFRYEGQLLPQVDYLGAGRVVAVGDSSLEFFSLAQENKPVLIKSIPLPSEISVYEAGNGHAAFLYSDPSTGKMTLNVYDTEGELNFMAETSGSFRSLVLAEKGVLFLSDTGLSYRDYKGRVRYSGSPAQTGSVMFMDGARKIIQFDGSYMYHYRLR